jgi:hypothetical protein
LPSQPRILNVGYFGENVKRFLGQKNTGRRTPGTVQGGMLPSQPRLEHVKYSTNLWHCQALFWAKKHRAQNARVWCKGGCCHPSLDLNMLNMSRTCGIVKRFFGQKKHRTQNARVCWRGEMLPSQPRCLKDSGLIQSYQGFALLSLLSAPSVPSCLCVSLSIPPLLEIVSPWLSLLPPPAARTAD